MDDDDDDYALDADFLVKYWKEREGGRGGGRGKIGNTKKKKRQMQVVGKVGWCWRIDSMVDWVQDGRDSLMGKVAFNAFEGKALMGKEEKGGRPGAQIDMGLQPSATPKADYYYDYINFSIPHALVERSPARHWAGMDGWKQRDSSRLAAHTRLTLRRLTGQAGQPRSHPNPAASVAHGAERSFPAPAHP